MRSPKIGVIGGTIVLNKRFFEDSNNIKISTSYGEVDAQISENIMFIQRHGNSLPPHRINHKANVSAFKDMGVKFIIGVCSVGSLRLDIKPGDIVIPDDYISFGDPSFFDDKAVFITPGLSERVRQALMTASKNLGLSFHSKGVYMNTCGPRLETKAEVRMFSRFADIVGMTMSREASLAKEANLEYAAVCSVDNYAHGIIDESLTNDEIEKNKRKNFDKIRNIVLETAKVLR